MADFTFLVKHQIVMKRLALYLLFTVLWASVFATGQECDIIYVGGQQWFLKGRPICYDSLLYKSLMERLPEHRAQSTANWDGFVGYWSVQDGALFLDSVTVYFIEENLKEKTVALPDTIMQTVFAKYYSGKRIFASWVTANLNIGQGKMIYYEHIGFARYYETEMTLHVENGKITEQKLFNNRIVLDGLPDENYWEMLHDTVKTFLLADNRYPQLSSDSIRGIVLKAQNCKVDSLGNLTEISLKIILIPYTNDTLVTLEHELEALLMTLKPWKVLLINDEYRPLWTGWSGLIRLRPKEQ